MLARGIRFLNSQQHFKNLTIYGVGQGFNLITPLLVIPYIIAICGLENYGKAAFGMALTFFLIVFIDYGSDLSGVKDVAVNRNNPEQLKKVFALTYWTKLVILIPLLVLMSGIFLFVPYFQPESDLYILGLPILIGQFLNPTWFLQGIEDFKKITTLNIGSKLIYVFGIFTSVNTAADYPMTNLWWGIGMIVVNAAGLIAILRQYNLSFSGVTTTEILENIRSGFPIFSSQIFVSVQLYSPLILIGFLGTPVLAGTYRVVDQVIVVFKTYILLFFNFLYPRVCYLLGANRKDALRFWKIYNGSNLIFVAVSMVAIFLFAENIVAWFNASDIASISKLLQIAVLIPFVMAISIPLKQLVLGNHLQKFYVRVTMMLVVVTQLLIVISLPILGILGVLLSLMLIEFTTAILYFVRIKKLMFST